MKTKLNILLTSTIVGAFMISFYGLMSLNFRNHKPENESNVLNHRFGTIMWHSSDKNGIFQGNVDGQSHVYCYYPTKNAGHESKGEYIIKRVNHLDECRDWLGTVIFKEDAWVSEREKLWWENS